MGVDFRLLELPEFLQKYLAPIMGFTSTRQVVVFWLITLITTMYLIKHMMSSFNDTLVKIAYIVLYMLFIYAVATVVGIYI